MSEKTQHNTSTNTRKQSTNQPHKTEQISTQQANKTDPLEKIRSYYQISGTTPFPLTLPILQVPKTGLMTLFSPDRFRELLPDI